MKTAIKRMCLEWLTIGCASTSVGLLALWVVSVTGTRTDFVLSESPRGFAIPPQLSLRDGAITISKNIDNLEGFDRWVADGPYDMKGRPFSLHLPGIVVRRICFIHEPTRWLFRFSLLFPTLAFAALAAGWFWRCRRASREWSAERVKAKGRPEISLFD